MTIIYITKRLRCAQAMAAQATDDCARIPHLEMVRRYKSQLARLNRSSEAVQRPLPLCAPLTRIAAPRPIAAALAA